MIQYANVHHFTGAVDCPVAHYVFRAGCRVSGWVVKGAINAGGVLSYRAPGNLRCPHVGKVFGSLIECAVLGIKFVPPSVPPVLSLIHFQRLGFGVY